MAKKSRRDILVAEDDDILRGSIVRALQDRGWQVIEASDGEQAIALAAEHKPSRCLLDIRLPKQNGLRVLQAILAAAPTTAVVMLSGFGSIAIATEAMRLGARYFLPKPADIGDILQAFERKAFVPTEAIETPSLARAEWEHINRVLIDTGTNISETARRPGIHRRSLQRKLQKYPPTK